MFKDAYELIIFLDGARGQNSLFGIYKKESPELFEQIESFFKQGYVLDAERMAQNHLKEVYKEVGADLFAPFLNLALFDTAHKLGSLVALKMLQKVLNKFFDAKIRKKVTADNLAFYYYALEKRYGLLFNATTANALLLERINFDLKSDRSEDAIRAKKIIAILWGHYDGANIRS
jgi:lysozyme family protein